MDPNTNDVLPATVDDVLAVNLEEPLVGAVTQSSSDICDAFARAAYGLETKGDCAEARVYRSIATLFSFRANYSQLGQPYLPFDQNEGKRSALPDDLTAKDLDVVEALFERSQDVSMRARFGDVLTLRKRCPQWWPLTVEAYMASADRALPDDDWHAVVFMHRGLQLAHRLGRKKPSWVKAEEFVLRSIRERWLDEEGYCCANIMRLMVEMDVGEPTEFAVISGKIADRALEKPDPAKSRRYRLMEAGWWSAAKDPARSEIAHQMVAETYVAEADGWLQRAEPNVLGAAGCLAKAVEALRQSRAKPERIDEIKQRLLAAQRKGMSEMKTTEFELDISGLVKAADKLMAHEKLPEALKRLAMRHPLVDPTKLKEEVREQGKEFIWQHLAGTSIVDSQGRVTHSSPPLFSQSGENFENALMEAMFAQARQSFWPMRVSAWIQPGRRRIWQDHEPILADLESLVLHNPFIPPSHAFTFQRGLHAGLSGDFLTAAYLLTPQIENSIRYVLEQRGADVSNLQSDLTQPVKLLGPLFDMPEFETVFGAEYRFELRGHLIEKQGFDFRNRICHGFATDQEAYSLVAVSVWWLALRLCVEGLLGRGV